MKIHGLHHAQMTIPSGHEAEARAFYCEFLGLTETPKPANLQSRGGLWLQLGGLQIHLGVQDDVDRARSKTHLAFEVVDLAGWRTRLDGAGVAVLEGLPIPGYERYEFRDPFGNRLEFLESEEGR